MIVLENQQCRLKRLCERDCDYLEALKALKDNCLKSCPCKALTVDMVEFRAEWKDRFGLWTTSEKGKKS